MFDLSTFPLIIYIYMFVCKDQQKWYNKYKYFFYVLYFLLSSTSLSLKTSSGEFLRVDML